MIKIQRASAGSGKTYALARQFILHLISRSNDDGSVELRGRAELEEIMPRILAITFTNKATNEMSRRIIDKLSALSLASNPANLTPEYIKRTDYLSDFANLTGKTYEEIGEICLHALKTIINNYSQFRISTIDSFFQEILRTFAYEANIIDNYQLEIDSEFISGEAVDATLNDLNRGKTSTNASYWLSILMNREVGKSQRWNVFTKSQSKNSIYTKVKEALFKLESEDYKEIKSELDEFFKDPKSDAKLRDFYEKFEKKAIEEREDKLKEINKALDKIEDLQATRGIPDSWFLSTFLNQKEKIRKLKADSAVDFKFTTIINKDKETGEISTKSIFKKAYANNGNEDINDVALDVYQTLMNWESAEEFPFYSYWNVYKHLFPYFGLILEVSKQLSAILENENTIRISDTSYILKRIIGEEDDSPFIYERMGNYIDNYLIDEFQDTSKLQWDVIKPLLRESVGRGFESLIIGDPKQSIYRFRNADHTLITEVVPRIFGILPGVRPSKSENTNWRSKRLIVEFNNYFFRNLSLYISGLSLENGMGYNFDDLYSNVVQYPNKRATEGYVEINFIEKDSEEDPGIGESMLNDEDYDWYDLQMLPRLCRLVSELLERGYHQKDIGILVNKNYNGKKIIDALIDYNQTQDPEHKIKFISEESLMLSSSPAVETIVSVIEKLSDGGYLYKKNESTDEDEGEKEEEGEGEGVTSKKRDKITWQKVKVNYNYFCLSHPELKGAERIFGFLNDETSDRLLQKMIAELHSPSLTSLVECIAEYFLDSESLTSEAIYIAAFQDIVTEYCAGHSNDPASFMEWWKSKGVKRSVSSPENIDAVQIMTIHKSKGLEFKCVIIPYAQDMIGPDPSKLEWRWVRPYVTPPDSEPVPFLPIETSSKLKNLSHGNLYRTFYDQRLTDTLNNYYVAFTRAKDELYVFAKENKRKSSITITDLLEFFCIDHREIIGEVSADMSESIIDTSLISHDEENNRVTVGVKPDDEKIKKEYEKEREDSTTHNKLIKKYEVNAHRLDIHCKASKMKESEQL